MQTTCELFSQQLPISAFSEDDNPTIDIPLSSGPTGKRIYDRPRRQRAQSLFFQRAQFLSGLLSGENIHVHRG
jgi:hypothetical protein